MQNAPAALQLIINRALAKNHEQRYQTASSLLTDLQTLQHGLATNVAVERIAKTSARASKTGDLPSTLAAGFESTATDQASKEITGDKVKLPARMKWHQLSVVLASAILVATAAWLFFGRGFSSRPPTLTNKDSILLADFINTTGDADFDGTLKQGLTVQLGQSPYINVFPEERARETLGLMERSHDEKITREVGREICQRRGIKVLMVSTIASLGSHYVITLEAVNSLTGDTVANQQT